MTEATINYDMQAYSLLTDHIIPQITASCEPDLLPAKELIEKIQRRKLYRFIGQTLLSSSLNFTVSLRNLNVIDYQQPFSIFKVYISYHFSGSSSKIRSSRNHPSAATE